MPNSFLSHLIRQTALAAIACSLAFALAACGPEGEQASRGQGGGRAAPVEAVSIEHGPISLFRTFNGTLEAQAEFMVAPKVGGRVVRLAVDLADTVRRGQVVAELDNDEYIQAVAQATADLAVTRANLVEAESGLEIATREFERVRTLNKRGVASESQFDATMAALSTKQAQLEVAKAQLTRAEALLKTANIRLGYTKVTADWSGGDEPRVVAERYVDAGHTVAANAPLFLIVDLNPITGLIHVTEKDYASLRAGQTALLSTDAYPGETFQGRVARISPVFRQETRQARVELAIDNPEFRLKPGLFIRATIELQSLTNATIIPEAALSSRHDQTGVFVVDEERMTVAWRPVRVGIRQGSRVQVEGQGLTGRVISLGHQLVDEGSKVIIATDRRTDAARP